MANTTARSFEATLLTDARPGSAAVYWICMYPSSEHLNRRLGGLYHSGSCRLGPQQALLQPCIIFCVTRVIEDRPTFCARQPDLVSTLASFGAALSANTTLPTARDSWITPSLIPSSATDWQICQIFGRCVFSSRFLYTLNYLM